MRGLRPHPLRGQVRLPQAVPLPAGDEGGPLDARAPSPAGPRGPGARARVAAGRAGPAGRGADRRGRGDRGALPAATRPPSRVRAVPRDHGDLVPRGSDAASVAARERHLGRGGAARADRRGGGVPWLPGADRSPAALSAGRLRAPPARLPHEGARRRRVPGAPGPLGRPGGHAQHPGRPPRRGARLQQSSPRTPRSAGTRARPRRRVHGRRRGDAAPAPARTCGSPSTPNAAAPPSASSRTSPAARATTPRAAPRPGSS